MMECKRVKSDIRRGAGAKWKSHLEECEDCRLFAAHDVLLKDNAKDGKFSSATTLDALFQNIANETDTVNLRTRLASAPGVARWVVAASVVSFIALGIVLFRVRADLHVYPSLRFFTELFLMGGLLALFVWLAVRPFHKSPVARWKQIGLMLITGAMVAVPLLLPAAHHDHPESLKGVGEDLWGKALACFVWGSIVGTLFAMTGRFLLRGGKKAPMFNVPLLWAAGLLALFSLHLHCPIVHSLHIALGHSSIMIGVWCVLLFRQ